MTRQKRVNDLSDLRKLFPAPGQQTGTDQPVQEHDGKGKTVHVALETTGRKGKVVTLISGLHHNPDTMDNIARILKQYCGAGGTVKGLTIEIQGDQRVRVAAKLRALNYTVK